MPSPRYLPICFAALLGASQPALAAEAIRFGTQIGATATFASRAGVSGKVSGPDLGLHAVIPLGGNFWRLRLYGEYQRFGFSVPGVIFPSSTGNSSATFLAQLAYQNYKSVLGLTYVGFGGGIGLEPSTGDSLPWAAVTWGTGFDRRFFIETRMQLPATGRMTEQLYFVLLLGIHFNPREETWKESLIREKSGR